MYDDLLKIKKHTLASLTASLSMLLKEYDTMNEAIKTALTTKVTNEYGIEELKAEIQAARDKFKNEKMIIEKKLADKCKEMFGARIQSTSYESLFNELGIESLRIEKELKENVELIDKLREEKEDLNNELKNLEGRLSAVIEWDSKVETKTDFPKIERGVEQKS